MESKKKALVKFLNITSKEEIKEIEVSSYNENVFNYYNQEYEILTEDEAEERWEEELQYYINEVILPEIPDCWQYYFDEEAWKRDARFDGRGHAISRYDGNENEIKIKDEYFFIYRQN